MLTLAGTATQEIEVRRSRFIAMAQRVDEEDAARAFLESVADPQATHNCWAWKIGQAYRFHDDGEPGGTAGRPILGAIEARGLDHVMVVVTRHFGGTKLGAGGLARAYAGAASSCLDRAPVREVRPRLRCRIDVAFEWTGPLYAALDSCEATRESEQYGPDGLSIVASIAEPDFPRLEETLGDATRGNASVRILG